MSRALEGSDFCGRGSDNHFAGDSNHTLNRVSGGQLALPVSLVPIVGGLAGLGFAALFFPQVQGSDALLVWCAVV